MSNIIEIKNLTLAYDGVTVVKNLSFEVPRGEIMLISGENGSGKSTLVKTLLGLHRESSGEIRFDGAGKGRVGYLPQKSAIGADFPATVREVIFSGFVGRLRHGMFLPRGAENDVKKAMELTGTDALAGKCYNELSGGQQQRVLLARALCAAGDLIILDEPTNALDPASAADMYKIIKSLKNDYGMTVLMVSHDLETSVSIADRVLHLCCDDAFCCPASEYAERLADAHADCGGIGNCESHHHGEAHHDDK